MAQSYLTSVERVKRYLEVPTANQDALIGELILAASRAIEKYTSRRFPRVSHTGKRLTGYGTQVLTLPETPIIAVTEVLISGVPIPPSASGSPPGYLVDETQIVLTGAQVFPRERLQVQVSWEAGYTANDTVTIPEPTGNATTVTVEPDDSLGFAADVASVVSAGGTEFTRVTGTPAAGEFALSGGVFTFAAADANTVVDLNLYVVPDDVEQACVKLVALYLRQRSNIGINSKSIGGESVSFNDRSMPPSVREVLNPYNNRVPA